jgi:hypothetical protein
MWRSFSLPPSENRLAYVFYATNHAYAIAVLVFVRLLRRLGIRGDADLLLLHLPLPAQLVTKVREVGMVPVLVPSLPYVDYPYFKDCLVKLRIFQLIEYDRVVYVDADAVPLKSLDDLLALPFDGTIAAPRAYWLPQPLWTSALLLARPSVANWDRVSRHFACASKKGHYDMEILNAEFGPEISTLPARILCLDSEWEDASRPGFFGDFDDTRSRVGVVHFTAVGKPWFYSTEVVRRMRPGAHPAFYELWQMWRKTREEIFVARARRRGGG